MPREKSKKERHAMKCQNVIGALLFFCFVMSMCGVAGCLPRASIAPFEGCDALNGEACTCANGMEGAQICEEGGLFCMCGIKEEMDLGNTSAPDFSAGLSDMTPVVDMSAPDMEAKQEDMPPADMEADEGMVEDMAPAVPMCGGVPCTCETGPLPAGWVSEDVGLVDDLKGSAGSFDGEWCVKASGSDIFYQSDGFHFVSREAEGNIEIVARLDAYTADHEWSKVGLMMREDDSPDARHVSMIVTARNGIMLVYRELDKNSSFTMHTPGEEYQPMWLRLTRRDELFEGATSTDGTTWTVLPLTVTQPNFASQFKVGLALTSHDNTMLSSAKFSGLEIQQK